MRHGERSHVEISESSSKRSDVEATVVVGPTAAVLVPVRAELVIPLGQLAGAAPLGPGQYKVLPDRPGRPVMWLVSPVSRLETFPGM